MQRRPQEAAARRISVRRAGQVIRRAVELGLDEFHWGSCGPAAVAINRVLFRGEGLYVVATNTVAKQEGRRSGHVAVEYRGKLFDYEGSCALAKLAAFRGGRLGYEITWNVREATVIRHFCLSHCRPIERAEALLTEALHERRSP